MYKTNKTERSGNNVDWEWRVAEIGFQGNHSLAAKKAVFDKGLFSVDAADYAM